VGYGILNTPLAFYILSNVLLAVATFLPRLRSEIWWVRVFDFPRLQLATVAAVLIAAELLMLDYSRLVSWILVSITSLCLVWQIRWVLPYTPLHRTEVDSSENPNEQRVITIMGANVLTPNRQAKRLIQMIATHQPDVIVAVETDDWWQKQLETVRQSYPHRVCCPQDNLYGMHLYSKLPLQDTSVQHLVQHNVPSIHTKLRLRSGHQVQLHCVHPAPPSPTENDESSERDAELVMVGRGVVNADLPVIVTGDLNDVAWSSTTRLFRKVSGLLDPRIGRGMFNTFHARWPFIRWPLDHLFHSGHFSLVRFQRLGYFGSDHMPILVSLALNHNGEDQNSLVERHREDIRRANKKLEDEGVSGDKVHTPE
jgi:endonuclease/exonuclease/phosphatase (EEP) superfamily protein YafD